MSENQMELSTLCEELNELLSRLVKVHRVLLDAVRREKELLIEVNIEELNENNQVKEKGLKRLRQLEQERIRLVRLIASNLNFKDEPVRLLDLAVRIGGEQGDQLQQKHAVLELLVKRMIENNKQNEQLAKSAMKNVGGALGVIKDSLQEKTTYERQGGVKVGASSSGNLVRREV